MNRELCHEQEKHAQQREDLSALFIFDATGMECKLQTLSSDKVAISENEEHTSHPIMQCRLPRDSVSDVQEG